MYYFCWEVHAYDQDTSRSLKANTPKNPPVLSEIINDITTVLASSGDGGMVQLWKPNVDGVFECVSHIQGDLSSTNSQIHDTTTSGAMMSG